MTQVNDSSRNKKIITNVLASVLTVAACSSTIASAAETGEWGIGVSGRHGTIPYKNDSADTVRTTIPQIYYEGEIVFLRDLEWGIKAYEDGNDRINTIIKRRFVSVPRRMQNDYQKDALDWGFQWIHRVNDDRNWRVEMLTETKSRAHIYAGHDWQLQYGDFELKPSAGLRYKSKKFNDYYYGLSEYEEFNGNKIGAGVEAEFGVSFRYPLVGGLHLTGALKYVYLDSNARGSKAVDDNGFGAVRLGFIYFESSKPTPAPAFAEGSYVRVSHGWATPSDMNEILRFKSVTDDYSNQLSSVFYGHPLANNWLGAPIDVYLTGGLAYHYENTGVDGEGRKVQDRALETVMAIKAYYNFTWPISWRFGIAEGLSYISKPSYIERAEMEKKDNNGSKLMNYLDVSFDANLGDLFGQKSMENVWAGYSMHHRSSFFKLASQFGRIKGGSNYNTLYLQWHY